MSALIFRWPYSQMKILVDCRPIYLICPALPLPSQALPAFLKPWWSVMYSSLMTALKPIFLRMPLWLTMWGRFDRAGVAHWSGRANTRKQLWGMIGLVYLLWDGTSATGLALCLSPCRRYRLISKSRSLLTICGRTEAVSTGNHWGLVEISNSVLMWFYQGLGEIGKLEFFFRATGTGSDSDLASTIVGCHSCRHSPNAVRVKTLVGFQTAPHLPPPHFIPGSERFRRGSENRLGGLSPLPLIPPCIRHWS